MFSLAEVTNLLKTHQHCFATRNGRAVTAEQREAFSFARQHGDASSPGPRGSKESGLNSKSDSSAHSIGSR